MKKSNNKRVVIGSFPEPVGGVSNFIYRLAEKNMASSIVDFYPSKKKIIPECFLGEVKQLKNKAHLYYLTLLSLKFENLFFNFSTVKSLILVVLIPKFSRKFELMLHNGVVNKQNFPNFILRFLLGKFDVIYAIGEKQYDFYLNLSLNAKTQIVNTSSFLLSDSCMCKSDLDGFNNFSFSSSGKKIIAFSGNTRTEYNLNEMLSYAKSRSDYYFCFFLYDIQDDEYKKIIAENESGNIFFYKNLSSQELISCLQSCTHLIRPTLVDSFGLITAEAVECGLKVLASDVCIRYKGVYTYKHSENYEIFFDDFIEDKLNIFEKSNVNFPQFKFLE